MTDMNSASGRGLLLNCTPGFANPKFHLASVTLRITAAKEVNDDRTPRPTCMNRWRRSYMAVAFVVHPATSKQRYRYVTNIASVIVLLRCKPHRLCTVLGRLHVLPASFRIISECLLSNPAWLTRQKRPFQLAKNVPKYAISTLIF